MPSEMNFSRYDEILKPLTKAECKELMDLYKKKYGDKNFHYLLMYNQNKWNQQLSEIGAEQPAEEDLWRAFRKTFYIHRDCDFRINGTYVSLHFDTMQSVSFHSWEPDLKELLQCLRYTSLIDWASGPLLTNVDLHFCDQVKQIAAEKGATVQRARTCPGLIMDHATAINLDSPNLPDGYTLKTLGVESAEVIHSAWPNKKEGSLQYVRGLIELNKTLGIFHNTEQSLVAWIFQNDFSGLGILQVLPEFQRRGFGSTLAACMCRLIAQTETVNISAWIVVENYKSAALLEKLGFEKYVTNEWIQLNRIADVS